MPENLCLSSYFTVPCGESVTWEALGAGGEHHFTAENTRAQSIRHSGAEVRVRVVGCGEWERTASVAIKTSNCR